MDKAPVKTKENLVHNEAYNDYMLAVSVVLIRLMIAIIGLFSIALIVIDAINITDTTLRSWAIALRSGYIAAVLLFVLGIKRIRTYRFMTIIISLYEIAAALLIMFVYSAYPAPDFSIQLLGAMILILTIFLVPNRWHFKVAISVVFAAAFLLYSGLAVRGLAAAQIAPATVYLFVEMLICGAFSLFYQRYQNGEFDSQQEMMRIYATDPLTKVGNRIMLQREAEQWMEFCNRHQLDLALVLVDVDDMKTVNDQRGHLVGDIVLQEAARVMSTEMRKNDVCVRWGGDEFVLLLPKTNAEQAECLIRRIKNAFANQEVAENLRITCSFGITSMSKGDSLELLVEQADASMYAAKKESKNAIRTSQ